MHDPYTKETGPIGKIFEAEKKKREQIPQPDSWWVRRCNGKRYYLQDAPKMFFGKLMVWIYEEGKNKVLHIPVATLLKRYDQYTQPHKTIRSFPKVRKGVETDFTGLPINPFDPESWS